MDLTRSSSCNSVAGVEGPGSGGGPVGSELRGGGRCGPSDLERGFVGWAEWGGPYQAGGRGQLWSSWWARLVRGGGSYRGIWSCRGISSLGHSDWPPGSPGSCAGWFSVVSRRQGSFYVLMTSLLRCSSHDVQAGHPACTVQWFSVHSLLCSRHHYLNISITPKSSQVHQQSPPSLRP